MPQQQGAFRAGYSDPPITRRVKAAVSSATSNKAGMLMESKCKSEFQTLAAHVLPAALKSHRV